MDDAVVVQVLDAVEQFGHVVSDLGLGHGLTALVQLQQGLKEAKKRSTRHTWNLKNTVKQLKTNLLIDLKQGATVGALRGQWCQIDY